MSLDLEYFDKDDLSRGLLLSFGDDEDYISYNLAWDEANAIVSVIIAHREMMDAKERLGRVPKLTPPGAENIEDAN
jgi:hypothetical protein